MLSHSTGSIIHFSSVMNINCNSWSACLLPNSTWFILSAGSNWSDRFWSCLNSLCTDSIQLLGHDLWCYTMLHSFCITIHRCCFHFHTITSAGSSWNPGLFQSFIHIILNLCPQNIVVIVTPSVLYLFWRLASVVALSAALSLYKFFAYSFHWFWMSCFFVSLFPFLS